jgi:hypothetical protein
MANLHGQEKNEKQRTIAQAAFFCKRSHIGTGWRLGGLQVWPEIGF